MMDQETKTEVKPEILLVEDDPIAIDLITTMLSSRYNIESISSGQGAIQKSQSKTYDLILLDINLGKGISGLEVVKEIRKMESYRSVPVIAVTAFAMVGDKEEFLGAGCDY